MLVVDDEPHILAMLQRLLREVQLELHGDPVAALESLLRDPPDAVLCDVMMPEMSGQELYLEAVAQRPALAGRFVFMSGGVLIGGLQDFFSDQVLLEKPFRREDLVAALGRAAGRRASAR